jgi:hypothetical protein
MRVNLIIVFFMRLYTGGAVENQESYHSSPESNGSANGGSSYERNIS